jgi:hypothetical protein
VWRFPGCTSYRHKADPEHIRPPTSLASPSNHPLDFQHSVLTSVTNGQTARLYGTGDINRIHSTGRVRERCIGCAEGFVTAALQDSHTRIQNCTVLYRPGGRVSRYQAAPPPHLHTVGPVTTTDRAADFGTSVLYDASEVVVQAS